MEDQGEVVGFKFGDFVDIISVSEASYRRVRSFVESKVSGRIVEEGDYNKFRVVNYSQVHNLTPAGESIGKISTWYDAKDLRIREPRRDDNLEFWFGEELKKVRDVLDG